MAQRLVFHIGLAKTGTTSFQHFCSDRRKLLRRRGVLYPHAASGIARNHSPLAASYLTGRERDFTIAWRAASRDKLVRTLIAELERSGAATGLVSSEHFGMHFDETEARQLAVDFARYECKVVITLRDTHTRFFSSYNTHVTAGGRLAIESYARAVLAPGTRFMRGREVARIWSDAFGSANVSVIDYDAEPDVTAAVLRQCGLAEALPHSNAYRRRESLGASVVESLRCANQAIVDRQGRAAGRNAAAWLQLTVFSILCRQKLVQSMRAGSAGTWALDKVSLDLLDEAAALDRRWFAEHFGLALRGAPMRQRIVVDEERPGSEAQMVLADALLTLVSRGLWRPSQALVAVVDWIAGRHRRGFGPVNERSTGCETAVSHDP